MLSNDVNLIFLGSWTYSEAEETSRSSKKKEDTTSLWLVMMSHFLLRHLFFGMFPTVNYYRHTTSK